MDGDEEAENPTDLIADEGPRPEDLVAILQDRARRPGLLATAKAAVRNPLHLEAVILRYAYDWPIAERASLIRSFDPANSPVPDSSQQVRYEQGNPTPYSELRHKTVPVSLLRDTDDIGNAGHSPRTGPSSRLWDCAQPIAGRQRRRSNVALITCRIATNLIGLGQKRRHSPARRFGVIVEILKASMSNHEVV
jgi:hypothetical protein